MSIPSPFSRSLSLFNRAKSADALIHVIDVNWLRKQNQMDFDLLENEFNQLLQNELMEKSSFDSKLKVIVINKCDLITSDQAQQLVQKLIANQPDRIVIPLSCTTGMNISGLIQTLSDNTQRLLQTSNEDGADTFVTARHRAHLGNTVQHLQRSIGLFESDCALAAFHLRQAIDELGRITGKVSVDQILDVIFKDFCIGK